MRQERENNVPKHEGSKVNPLRRLSSIELIGPFPPFALPRDGDGSKEEGFEEIRLALHQEGHGEGQEDHSRKENGRKQDGPYLLQQVFEPFLNPEPQEGSLFVNNYGGNYAHDMQLNRGAVERVLQIAHLNGKVLLTNLQPSRSRSEAQGDELAAKRFGVFDRRTQKAEEENPQRRIVSVPEGWRIEINDQRLTEELAEKGLTGERLQKAFINKFNSQLKEGLRECVWREKCSSEKDKNFRPKLTVTVSAGAALLLGGFGAAVTRLYILFPIQLGLTLLSFGIINKGFDNERYSDHPLETFLPPAEFDRIGRTFAYLAMKGRTLVREAKEK